MKKSTKKQTSSSLDDWCMLVARIFLIAPFVMSMFGKLFDFGGNAAWIGSAGYPLPELLLLVAIILEVVGVVSVALGYKMKIGAAALILFTVLATLMFHIGPGEEINLLKNMAIVGGLLLLTKVSPGKIALNK